MLCSLPKDFHLYCLIRWYQHTPKLGIFNLPIGIMDTVVFTQDETARKSHSQDTPDLPSTPQLLACLFPLALNVFVFSLHIHLALPISGKAHALKPPLLHRLKTHIVFSPRKMSYITLFSSSGVNCFKTYI